MDLKPEIVALPARTFAGIQARFISARSADANNLRVIPALWGEFFARIRELRPVEPGVFHGLCDCGAAIGETISRPDEVFYLAGVQVAPESSVPAGMSNWESPAGTYAKFILRGRVERIGAAMDYIYGTWLPSSDYVSDAGPDLERYDSNFDPTSADSTLEIYIPVARTDRKRTHL